MILLYHVSRFLARRPSLNQGWRKASSAVNRVTSSKTSKAFVNCFARLSTFSQIGLLSSDDRSHLAAAKWITDVELRAFGSPPFAKMELPVKSAVIKQPRDHMSTALV